MLRLAQAILVVLTMWAAPMTLPAQQRANLNDQQAIELAVASYLKTKHNEMFTSWQVDTSWALDPRTYVFPERATDRIAMRLANDSATRASAPQSQRSSEMMTGRTSTHIQNLANVLGARRVLDDDPVCKVTSANLCRFGTAKGLIWITAASVSDAKGSIQVILMNRYLGRGEGGSQVEKIGSVSWTCEMEKNPLPTSGWSVVRCLQFNT